MSTVNILIDQLQKEFDKILAQSDQLNESLERALITSIQQTMTEIKDGGANSEYFNLMTLLNFVIATRDVPEEDVKSFLHSLKQK